MDLLKRQNFSSGAPFEDKAGYSRAVRIGNMVFVGGTTSTTPEGVVEAEGDAYLQTKIIFQKIKQALENAGARLSEVYRVRMYVTDISRGGEYMRAYSEFFKEIRPVITMAEVSALARPTHLIEIEAEAMLGSYRVRIDKTPMNAGGKIDAHIGMAKISPSGSKARGSTF